MSAVAFHEAARQYAAAGIASLPLGGEDGKRPLVKRWGRFGIRASLKIAPKFQDANLGFVCGRRSNLTVVDIDSADESELRWTQDTFGPSPIIVRTGSGKFHAWYRHNGERRRIRPIEGHEIDLLGEGGYCAAPPSVRPNGGRYEFLQGNLDKVADLPTIRPEALDWLSARAPKAINRPANDAVIEGTRNDSLFDLARSLAWNATSRETFLIELRKANGKINTPPLPDAEVERMAASVWRYKLEGRLFRSGSQHIVFDGRAVDRLGEAGDADAALLLLRLRKSHAGAPVPFAASPAAMAGARILGPWDARRYRNALRRLCQLGLLERVSAGGRGPHDPALYRLT